MPQGPNGQKRPADVIGNAVRVAMIATGEVEDTTLNQPAKRASSQENSHDDENPSQHDKTGEHPLPGASADHEGHRDAAGEGGVPPSDEIASAVGEGVKPDTLNAKRGGGGMNPDGSYCTGWASPL